MKKLKTLTLACVTSTYLGGQCVLAEVRDSQELSPEQSIEPVEGGQNTVNAQSALATSVLKAKLAKLKTYAAQFSQTVTDTQQQVLQTAEGQIFLMQPDKMLWEVSEPNENTLIADGHTLWHIDPFVEQVVAIDQAEAVASNPVMLLTSPDSKVWQDFDISQDGNTFTVVSKVEGSQIVSLLLNFEKDTLISLTFVDRQQQKSLLVFDEIQQNTEVSENTFTFSLPEGFDLDDQRL